MDYYSILGVSKNATQEEIKKAYKQKAMEHHPDRGGDHNTFATINEAYETLRNPQKRAEYDQPKPQFNFRSADVNAGNFEDIFSSFFGARAQTRRNRDIRIALTIELEEVLTGKDIILNYSLMNNQPTSASVRIHPGVNHGEAIRFKGLGDNSISSLPRGDLLVQVRVNKHKKFDRDGRNLYTNVDISVLDLILGTSITLETLSKNRLNVNIPKGTQPGTTMSISGYGLPDPRIGRSGNLYITVKGTTPKINDESLLERIKQINDDINHGS